MVIMRAFFCGISEDAFAGKPRAYRYAAFAQCPYYTNL